MIIGARWTMLFTGGSTKVEMNEDLAFCLSHFQTWCNMHIYSWFRHVERAEGSSILFIIWSVTTSILDQSKNFLLLWIYCYILIGCLFEGFAKTCPRITMRTGLTVDWDSMYRTYCRFEEDLQNSRETRRYYRCDIETKSLDCRVSNPRCPN